MTHLPICANLTFANPYNRPVGEALYVPPRERVDAREAEAAAPRSLGSDKGK